MKKSLVLCLLAASLAPIVPLHALPRDAEAVLNRCGKPLQGDEIVYDNSIAGGHRTLKYERGTLVFNRLENTGWTFAFGNHHKEMNLDAEAMEKYMPCIKDALADSAAPEPIKKITSVQRVEASLKRELKTVILFCAIFLVLLAAFFYWLSTRPQNTEGLVG